jgi:hypothetical protein
VLREIISDYNPSYSNDDLLALYTVTGGVPKYVELLMDRGAYCVTDIIDCVLEENSIFLEEGTILLATEFGKKYGNYFSILSAIASGRNTASEISAAVGDTGVMGMLARLEDDYELISRKRPICSKERSQNVRYEINDKFLRFWFRYVSRHQNLIQMGLNDHLRDIVIADYPTYSGMILEGWFRQKLRESKEYTDVGSWWNNSKGKNIDQMEIDIVAIPLDNDRPILAAEVKRQRKNFKPELLQAKIEHLKTKILPDRDIEPQILTLDDM